jgi:DNA polymerase V
MLSPLVPLARSSVVLKLFSSAVAAGFPSPADDYVEKGLSMDDLLIKHPSSTYLARASGDSMTGCGILDGDILIIDRSLTAENGDIVIAAIDGELACKFLDLKSNQLTSANSKYPPIKINEEAELLIEGIVISSIRQHRPCTPW